jgi:predicted transcriptional regulator
MESPRGRQLPAHLRAFLYSCIDSIEQLDVLMLLRASGEGRTAREVAREVGVSDSRARAFLDALAARGFVHAVVRSEVTYTYRPSSDALRKYTDELADELERSRADVLRFVAALPPSSVRSFANAFKLRDSE